MRSSFSVTAIINGIRDAMRRFPSEGAVAIIGTIVALVAVNGSDLDLVKENMRTITSVIVTAPMLLVLFLALSVAHERGGLAARSVLIGRVVATALAGIIIASLSYTNAMPVEVATLFIASHAIAALAPYHRGALATWNFNRALLLRMCLALVFTGVLTGGVMVAIGSLDVLFGLRAEPEVYGSIVTIALGLFNTFFVLSGIPTGDEEERTDLPRSLRWFIQFVLIPLVGIFLVILYAYGFKVVFLSELKGAVAGYVLAMGVASLLAWVLAWPLRDDPEQRFVGFYVRWLGPVMVPMAVLLTVAIAVRIMDFGVTPDRFAVATLTAFFDVTILYLTVWRRPDLRMVPLVLSIIGAITALGPLGSVAVTVRNQLARANALLASHGIGETDRIDSVLFSALPLDERKAWFSSVQAVKNVDTLAMHAYLTSHGLRADPTRDYWLGIVGLKDPRSDPGRANYSSVYFPADSSSPLDAIASSRQYAMRLRDGQTAMFDGNTIRSSEHGTLFVITNADGVAIDSIEFKPLIKHLDANNKLTMSERHVISTAGRHTFVVLEGEAHTFPDGTVTIRFDGILAAR